MRLLLSCLSLSVSVSVCLCLSVSVCLCLTRSRVSSVPTTFIYGTADWMFSEEAVSVVNQLRRASGTRAAATLIRIRDAGHQLSLDNPIGFRDAMRYAVGKGGRTEHVIVE